MSERIGFISTRFAGTDGVSLESLKWAEVLEQDGHSCFWFAGKIDRAPEISLCVPEAHFGHGEIEWINRRIWGTEKRDPNVAQRIRTLAEYIKSRLYDFVETYDISLIINQNALTIPMNVPLGIAITEFLVETGIPSISHHHDFYWERTRFQINCVPDLLEMAFPPRIPHMQHVVINEAAQETLSWRKGVSSVLVPNVIDFDSPPPTKDAYTENIREEIGLKPDDIMILQPTRVVPRKGIEHAIKLVEMLGDPKFKLVISHDSGDEGFEYHQQLSELAQESNVDIRFIATKIGEARQLDADGNKIYTLWDVYPYADMVSYPSLYEGFGNALLEAVYFRKPVLINRYAIFARDIEPKGFKFPTMDGILTKKVVEEVRRIFGDEAYRNQMMEHNYELAQKFYSYTVLRRKLQSLIANLKG